MKGKTVLFFFILISAGAAGVDLYAREPELPAAEKEVSAADTDAAASGNNVSEGEIVVRRGKKKLTRKYALSFQVLDPVLKSLLSSKKFDFAGEEAVSRLIIPSFSVESQFELHRYVTLGVKGSVIPELIANPFYRGIRGGYFYTDPESAYPDPSLDEENWAHRVYNDGEKYFLNMHFLVDLTVRVLPFGEGLDTLRGFYIKAGGYFGFSVYQNVYLSYDESKAATVGGEVSSASIPYFYPVEVSDSGNGEDLYEFVFGAVIGLGWQFVFPSGFYLDVGADLTYDNARKLIPSVPGLGWNANCAIGYAW